ncbi:hypothetical protein [Dipodfec virus UOA04_Rod_771]|nr:hypothetical protein [Dipodfec virus UOA04_Rod_771]
MLRYIFVLNLQVRKVGFVMSISDKVAVIKEIASMVTSLLPKIVDLVIEVIGAIKELKSV